MGDSGRRLASNLASAQAEVSRLREDLSAAQLEMERLRSKIAQQDSKIAQQETSVAQFRDQDARLKAQLEEANQSLKKSAASATVNSICMQRAVTDGALTARVNLLDPFVVADMKLAQLQREGEAIAARKYSRSALSDTCADSLAAE